jgi:hypothetical protein
MEGDNLLPRDGIIFINNSKDPISAGYSTLANNREWCPVDRMAEVVIGCQRHH